MPVNTESSSLLNEARQHLHAGRVPDAESICLRVLDKYPGNAEARALLGSLYNQTNRPEMAVECLEPALEGNPADARCNFQLGLALARLERTDEAIDCHKQALQMAPANAAIHFNLGLLLEETGQLDSAAYHYQQAIMHKPDMARAHFHLAYLKNRPSAQEEIDAMLVLYNHPGTSINQRVWLAYGIGSALDKQGRYQDAFDYFQAGHTLKHQSVPFDMSRHIQFTRAIASLFDRNRVNQSISTLPLDTLQPVFIFGMPRSGTSLTEQILASHPDVYATGESGHIEDAVKQVITITGKPFLQGWRELDTSAIHSLGSGVPAILDGDHHRYTHFTDTTPMNFLYVGMIAAIFPNARLVHCQRDPMDTCLSIFQQPLSETHAYAHDLKDLGMFYLQYRNLMQHWYTVIPGRIHDLRYEDMVTDSESGIRKLLDYCGLPFDEHCLKFHETARSVRTPSASQVRQPIYTASIGRWKNYESRLTPLKIIIDAGLPGNTSA